MRKLLAAAVMALGITIVPAAAPLPGGASTGGTAVRADLDGNAIFDDLEARLVGVPDQGLVDVIVVLAEPATTRIDALKAVVGPFAVARRFSLVDGFAATMTKGQIEALARLPGVEHIEENSIVTALNDSAQASFGVTKARLDAPGLDGDADGSVATYSKDDLVAAVVDTGIDANHRDLDEGKVLAFKDFVNSRTAPYDDHGHGTHVSATIAGDGDARADRLYKGVAPAAGLVGVKVLNAQGSGSLDTVVAGIDWVVTNKDVYGIEAINLSLGTSGCSDGTDAVSTAVNRAVQAGIVVVAAAGNSGPNTCTVGSPAAAANAITAGAMADLGVNGFKQAYFSSRGPTADGRLKPDVSSPGVTITSALAGTTDGYVVHSGTSMATPFVVGVALLMLDANRSLTPLQVKDDIVRTAVDWGRGGNGKTAGTRGPDVDYGAGRLDAYAAIRAAGAAIDAAPEVPAHELQEGSLSGTGAQVDFDLSVADLRFPIAATLVIPGAAVVFGPNFDLFLFDPSGTQVAVAQTSRRQEEFGYTPTVTGTYRLSVRSASGSGDFFVDVSAGLGAPPPPPPPAPPPPPPPPDTTPPTITAVSPPDGGTGVAATTNVAVTFSEPMNTVATEGAFTLVRSSDGAPVSGTFSWGGSKMTFDPADDLAPGAMYTARVSTAARDSAGNPLAAETSWSFTITTERTAFPTSTTILSGTLRGGGAAQLAADDDAYYEVNSTAWTVFADPVSSWYATFTVPNELTSLKITYKGKNTAPFAQACAQTVAVRRWSDGVWVQLDARSVGSTEVAIADLTPPGALADYVSGATGPGEVNVRVQCTITFWSFYASGDLMKLVYGG